VRATLEAVVASLRPGGRVVLFDFDGTLSLIRSGWMQVMVPMMVEILGGLRTGESEGDLTAVVEDFAQPNGLAFSPDERRLFIVDSQLHHVRVFNVDHGKLTGGELFCADDKGYDGIRFDHLGRLWGAAYDGLHCYDPDGTLIGKLRLPEITANLTFGGPQRNHLYMTATSSLYSLRVNFRAASYPS